MRSSLKWQVMVIGKPALPWAMEAVNDYSVRLRKAANVEVAHLKAGTKQQNGTKGLEATKSSWRVVLDATGKQHSSEEFAQWIARQEMSGRKRVSFLIGGADGHSPEVMESADEVWSLSKMTLQHELALVVFLEQLYRAYSILRGDPYHRP